MNLSPRSSVSYFSEQICGFTAVVTSFSKEDVHRPGLSRDTEWPFPLYVPGIPGISLSVYANGNRDKNEGFVSLFIRISELPPTAPKFPSFTTSIVISVLDVYGNQRFPQSATLTTVSSDESDVLSIDRFVERKTLLSQDSEFLPNDTLTVYVDFYSIHGVPYNDQFDCAPVNFCDSVKESTEDRVKLKMNSRLFYELAKESEVFRRILLTPMREAETECMEVSSEEFYHLECFGLMLTTHFDGVFDVPYICEMYKTAHIYRIETVLQACREFITKYLSHEIIDEISEFAKDYEDDDLKGRVKEFLEKSKYQRKVNSDSVSTGGSKEKNRQGKKYVTLYISYGDNCENDPGFDFYQ